MGWFGCYRSTKGLLPKRIDLHDTPYSLIFKRLPCCFCAPQRPRVADSFSPLPSWGALNEGLDLGVLVLFSLEGRSSSSAGSNALLLDLMSYRLF